MTKIILLLPLLTACLAGADISGKWSGTIDIAEGSGGGPLQTPVIARFVQKSDEISGKIGRSGEDEEEGEIRNGRVEGSKVWFEVASPQTVSAMKFTLTLEGDRLTGEMKGSVEDGEIVGKVELTRKKENAGATP